MKSLFKNPKILAAFIGILTFLVFSPSCFNGYTNWDDPVYVLENPAILKISPENIKNIFTTSVHGSYLPLSILTYAVEYHFVQLNPKILHLTNVLLHVGNAILVFWVISLLLGNIPVALLTALLFALCPLRVESVAWITQRKDLLYSFFSLCGFLTYLKHLQFKLNKHILMTFFFFVLALLSKPQAIAFPVFLILIDSLYNKKRILHCITNKFPFFILSLIFLLIALKVISPELVKQSMAGAFSLPEKIFLTAYALFLYLLKSLFPFHLSCLYPFPHITAGYFPWTVYAATTALLLGGIFLYQQIKNEPQYRFGILWFLSGLILPLSNIWVGGYLFCEHYTYLASIGLYSTIAVLIHRLFQSTQSRSVKEWTIVLCSIYVLFFSINSVSQSFIWNNSIILWSNAIKTFPNLPIAYNNRAAFYISIDMPDKALADSNQAIALIPNDVSYFNRGITYAMMGDQDAALKDFSTTIQLNHQFVKAYFSRALIYKLKQDYRNALLDLENTLRLNPQDTQAFQEYQTILNLIEKE